MSWTAPSDDGNSPVTSYDLRHIPSGSPDKADANWTVIDPAWESGRLRYEITGLTNDTEYDVQVRAVNAKGDGAWSETATGTPRGAGGPDGQLVRPRNDKDPAEILRPGQDGAARGGGRVQGGDRRRRGLGGTKTGSG